MSERAPLPEIVEQPAQGRVLAAVPHPDDDVIGCGGTLALHADAGDEVHVLVAFDGLAGDAGRGTDPVEYIARRKREARAGGSHLGISRYTFWDNPEGHEPADAEVVAAAKRVATLASELRPATVYAPWIGEYHIDHHVLARIVRIGLALIGFEGRAWGFEVWTPLVPIVIVDVSRAFERKRAALHEHRSQFEVFDLAHHALGFSGQRAMYCRRGARHGEAFVPLGSPGPHDRALVEAARREDSASGR